MFLLLVVVVVGLMTTMMMVVRRVQSTNPSFLPETSFHPRRVGEEHPPLPNEPDREFRRRPARHSWDLLQRPLPQARTMAAIGRFVIGLDRPIRRHDDFERSTHGPSNERPNAFDLAGQWQNEA